MKVKTIVYISISFLLSGIILNILNIYPLIASICIVTGVLGKLSFVIIKVRKNKYKVGIELLFLVVGLTIFLTGIYKPFLNLNSNIYLLFILIGISLKVIFVILFILKIRGKN